MFGRKKIGIALSGGAARGLAHVGVLQVLEGLGVDINAVSGTSMGAIVGAVYSLGIDLEEIVKYIKETDWRSFLLFSVFGLSKSGIINDRKVDEVLTKFLGDKTFDDCAKPFCCVAADIRTGKKVVINYGKLKEAVRASIAVPGIFPPVYSGGKMLVDGGVVEPLPTEAIKIFDCNFIIASSIVFENEDGKGYSEPDVKENRNYESSEPDFYFGHDETSFKKLSIQTILDRSMSIMHTQMVKSYTEQAQIVIEPMIGGFGFFDFTKGEKIIEVGRRAAERKVPEIKRKLRIR